MKKALVLLGIVIILALIVFTLFHNRAEMKQESRLNLKIAYPVSVTPVTAQAVNGKVAQVGLITANSDINIISQIQGEAMKIFVDEGSYVTAGAPIVKIDDRVPQANYLSAQTNYQKAQKDWERANELHKQELISDTELETYRLTFKAAEAQYVSAQHDYETKISGASAT